LLAFSCIVFVGQFIVTTGVQEQSWATMITGRFVFGLAGENVDVAASALLVKWFSGREVSLACGTAFAVGLMGNVATFWVSPAVANIGENSFTYVAFYLGVIMAALTVIMSFLLLRMDKRATRKLMLEQEATALLTASLLEDQSVDANRLETSEAIHGQNSRLDGDATVGLCDVRKFGLLLWLLALLSMVAFGCVLPFNNVASGVLLERNYFSVPPEDCTLRFPNKCTAGTLAPEGGNPSTDSNGNACPSPNFAPVLPSSLNVTQKQGSSSTQSQYVYNPLSPGDVDCADTFWSEACTKNYCEKQDEATEVSGRIMSILYFSAAILSPLLGVLVDRIGYKALISALSPVMLIIGHSILGYAGGTAIAALVFLGIAFSIYNGVIWPSVAFVVDGKLMGTAYGVITSMQNVVLAVFPLIIAALYQRNNRYIPDVAFFFVLVGAVGFVGGITLNLVDKAQGGTLNNLQHKDSEQNTETRTPDTDEMITSMSRSSEQATYIT